jgi:Nucleotidyltransferase domain
MPWSTTDEPRQTEPAPAVFVRCASGDRRSVERNGHVSLIDSRKGPVVAPGDDRVLTPEVAEFGGHVAEALDRTLGGEVVGVYFVGSVALGGYVPGESDIDMVAVSRAALARTRRHAVASAVVEASAACPTRGLELTVYRHDVAVSPPAGADFEVNANGGPGMPTVVHTDVTRARLLVRPGPGDRAPVRCRGHRAAHRYRLRRCPSHRTPQGDAGVHGLAPAA